MSELAPQRRWYWDVDDQLKVADFVAIDDAMAQWERTEAYGYGCYKDTFATRLEALEHEQTKHERAIEFRRQRILDDKALIAYHQRKLDHVFAQEKETRPCDGFAPPAPEPPSGPTSA